MKDTLMFIAHVTFTIAEKDRDLAIETLTHEVESVRAMLGCIAFTPFLDATNSQNVGVLHEWDSAEHFAAYIASDSFKGLGDVLRPISLGAPVSKRFDATLLDT